MLAVLWAHVREEQRDVWYVHGTRNGAAHAFRQEVEYLVKNNTRLHKHVFYSQPRAKDLPGRDYDAQGRITAGDLLALETGLDAHYMLCGPTEFMADLRTGMEAAGIPASHIHVETFGSEGEANITKQNQ